MVELPNVNIDNIFQYTAQIGIYRVQVFKSIVITTLVLIFLLQMFHGTSGLEQQRELLVIKPDDVYNSHYDSLIDSKELDKMNLNGRCTTFFDKLSANQDFKDFEWFNSNLKDVKIAPSLKSFIQQKKVETQKKNEKVTNDKVKEWEKIYNNDYATDKIYIKKLIDFISNLRVFGTCFIENNLFQQVTGAKAYNLFWSDEVNKELESKTDTFQLSNELEIRLFPWVSKIYPVYKHGLQQLGVGIPSVGDAHNDEDYNAKSSFLYNFKHGLNGEGIVIPLFDIKKDVEYAIRLSKVLRFLDNKLPIQFVHKGDLDEMDEKKIYQAYTKTLDPEDYFLNIDETFLGSSLPSGFNKQLPKQDVYFANIKMSLSDRYQDRWTRSSFKNFALLFSSFQRVLLLDPSVLPLEKVLKTLATDSFEKYGSYYYPDLKLDTPVDLNELEFFKDLLPNKVDEHLFQINQVNDEFLKTSRFFSKGYTSIINNDIIAIDKKDHFLGLLIALTFNHLPLNFATKSISNEFAWLGPALSGVTPELPVANHDIGIAGTFTDDRNRRIQKSASKEICSMHKTIFDSSDNTTALYITNGAFNCDRDGLILDAEITKPAYRGFNGRTDALLEWNTEKTKLKYAIVPIDQEIRAPNDIDEIAVSITNEEEYCNSEIWCAYDLLGAKNDKKYEGRIIEFDAVQHQIFEYVQLLWATLDK